MVIVFMVRIDVLLTDGTSWGLEQHAGDYNQ